MKNFVYVTPESVADAGAAASVKGAVLKAGGIDLLDLMKNGVIEPLRLVSLHNLKDPGMRTIAAGPEGLSIGALATLADLAAAADVPASLREASRLAATPQIRNVGTVGGNLAQRPRCWYLRSATFPCARKGGDVCYARKGENKYHAIFDNDDCSVVHASSLAAPLLALDAVVVTTKRKIPIDQFFVPTTVDITREHVLEAGEIITSVLVPPAAKVWKDAYREIGERDSQDWSLVSAAVSLDLSGGTVRAARVVMNGVAAVPYRMAAAERALAGKAITATTAAAAAQAAFAAARPLEQNEYKIPMGKVILRRAILAAAGLPEIGG